MLLLQRLFGIVDLAQIPVVVVLILLSVLAPTFGARAFERLEGGLKALAARPVASIAFAAALVLALRAAVHPWVGPPPITWPDDASLILQAKTYLMGRLANPAPEPAESFRSVYAVVGPHAYGSMYPPGRGLPLVLGGLLGHLWFGVVIVA